MIVEHPASHSFEFMYGVYIGRFDPFHNAHFGTGCATLKRVWKLIYVLGSDAAPRTHHSPFTSAEREQMIRESHGKDADRLIFIHLEDFDNMDTWVAALQNRVYEIVGYDASVALTGFRKDSTSSYLEELHWPFIGGGYRMPQNGTDIRAAYFEQGAAGVMQKPGGKSFPILSDVPEGTAKFLTTFEKTPDYALLRQEYLDNKEYVKRTQAPVEFFVEKLAAHMLSANLTSLTLSEIHALAELHLEKYPQYPVQFNTVDVVAIHRGHVLVTIRKNTPGKGLYALPGGFVEKNETLEKAAIRELREETRIAVSKEDLLRYKVGDPVVFDSPYRSLRGRTFTHAFLIRLPRKDPTPKVRKEEAEVEHVFWMPIGQVMRQKHLFFEDHARIIQAVLSKYPVVD